MMDGFVYGAVCGLGFAVVEDVFYFMGVFGGHPGGVLQGFFLRVVSSGLYSHVLYSGLVGMGIGYFVSRRDRQPLARRVLVAGRAVRAPPFSGTSCGTHRCSTCSRRAPWTGMDLLMMPVATAVKGLPLLGFATSPWSWRAGASGDGCGGARRRGRRAGGSQPTSSASCRSRVGDGRRWPTCGRVPGAARPGCSAVSSVSR